MAIEKLTWQTNITQKDIKRLKTEFIKATKKLNKLLLTKKDITKFEKRFAKSVNCKTCGWSKRMCEFKGKQDYCMFWKPKSQRSN